MASAWGNSWGTFWGNSWGSVGAVVVEPAPSPGGRIVGGTFSRGKWRELHAAWRAQEHAERKAREFKTATRRKRALEQAAQVAAEALDQARHEEETTARLVELTAALEVASSAKRVSDALEASQYVVDLSRAIMREMEDDDEEIMLLMAAL
jgi:hypothetical protein